LARGQSDRQCFWACPRYDGESHLDEAQGGLSADRTSTSATRAGQLRLWFGWSACVLLCVLRHIGLAFTLSPSAARCAAPRGKRPRRVESKMIPFTTVVPKKITANDFFLPVGAYWSLAYASWSRIKLVQTVFHARLDLLLRACSRHPFEFMSEDDMHRVCTELRAALRFA